MTEESLAPPSAAPAPEPQSGPLADWSPGQAMVGLLVVVAIVFVIVNLAVGLGADPDKQGVDLLLQAVLAMSLVAVPVIFANGTGSTISAAVRLGLRRFALRDIGRAFIAYACFFVFLVVYGVIVQPDAQDTVEVIADERDTLALIALGVLVVVAAPISEEIFFRGFFFGGLRSRMPFWAAALLSGLLFGLVHIPSGVAQAPPLAVLGIVLAWLYERSGSLGPPMLMHAMQNVIAFSYTVASN